MDVCWSESQSWYFGGIVDLHPCYIHIHQSSINIDIYLVEHFLRASRPALVLPALPRVQANCSAGVCTVFVRQFEVPPRRKQSPASPQQHARPVPSLVFHLTIFGVMDAQKNLPKVPSDIKFRVLIIGRANAGKTSILQRVCDTTESPEIYRLDPNGKRERVRSSLY
jgi:hypothetical protein